MKTPLCQNKLLTSVANSSITNTFRTLPQKENTKKVLFIDDSSDMRMIMYTVFSSTKWKIICAENGAIGLKLAKKIQPNLIICDINMPELDGYQVLKEIRADSNIANIPFIFLSSETKAASRHLAKELGADYFLRKPVDFGELLELLATLMPEPTDQTI